VTRALNIYKKKGGNLGVFDVGDFERELAHVAVLEAAQTLRDKPNRQLLVHVKDCAVEVLREAEADQQKELRQLTPELHCGSCGRRMVQHGVKGEEPERQNALLTTDAANGGIRAKMPAKPQDAPGRQSGNTRLGYDL
jgi:intracellular sulfur oxidation DsrE/DsrF family protein